MNTWIVGDAPVGFHSWLSEEKLGEALQVSTPLGEVLGEKTFFMKGRIMAGQFVLRNSPMDLRAFKWLVKEELENELDPTYFRSVRHMLVAQ